MILLIHKIQQTSCYWNPLWTHIYRMWYTPKVYRGSWKWWFLKKQSPNFQGLIFRFHIFNFRGVDSNWLTWPQDIEFQSQENEWRLVVAEKHPCQYSTLPRHMRPPIRLKFLQMRIHPTEKVTISWVISSWKIRFFPCGAIYESIHQMCQHSWAKRLKLRYLAAVSGGGYLLSALLSGGDPVVYMIYMDSILSHRIHLKGIFTVSILIFGWIFMVFL